MLGKLLLLPIVASIKGFTAVAGKIAEQVDRECFDKTKITRKLIELERAFDLGQISEVEYRAQEQAALEELDAIEALDRADEEGEV
jgi:hypothetical protein